MTLQSALLTYWLMAAIVWHKTNRPTLPPTRVRAGAAVALGTMLILFGVAGLLVGGIGTPSELAALALTGPIYLIVAYRIRSLVPRPHHPRNLVL